MDALPTPVFVALIVAATGALAIGGAAVGAAVGVGLYRAHEYRRMARNAQLSKGIR